MEVILRVGTWYYSSAFYKHAEQNSGENANSELVSTSYYRHVTSKGNMMEAVAALTDRSNGSSGSPEMVSSIESL